MLSAVLRPVDGAAGKVAASRSACRVAVGKGRVGQRRSALYSILAQSLGAPSQELGRAIDDGMLLSTIRQIVKALPRAHQQDDAFLRSEGVMDRVAPEGASWPLAAEHARLFGTDLVCPHCESDYLAEQRSDAETAAAVVALYARSGLNAGDSERADFIGAELEFMSFLTAREAHAASEQRPYRAKSWRRMQTDFFAEHLGRWGRPYARRLGLTSGLAFYKIVGVLLEHFVLGEARYFGLSIDDLERDCSPAPQPERTTTPERTAQRETLAATGCGEPVSCDGQKTRGRLR